MYQTERQSAISEKSNRLSFFEPTPPQTYHWGQPPPIDCVYLLTQGTRRSLCARLVPPVRLRLEKRSDAQIPLKHPSFASKRRFFSRKARLRRWHRGGAEDSSLAEASPRKNAETASASYLRQQLMNQATY